MLKLRIDRAAMITGSVIVGLYTMNAAHLIARSGGASAWSIDRMMLMTVMIGIAYAAIFAIGNRIFRHYALRSRGAYLALGAFSALPAFTMGVGIEFFAKAAANGSLSLALLRPILVGLVTGFLYRRRAGFETEGDDTDTLAIAATGLADAEHSGTQHIIKTATAEYYDGPVQVRTSFIAALISAAIGASIHSLFALFVLASGTPVSLPPPFNQPGIALANAIAVISIPYVIFVLLAHRILLRAEKTRMTWYVVAAIGTPIALGMAIGLLGLGLLGMLVTSQFIVPSVIAMAAYRSLAGLEPKALPEDIEITDRRTMLPADHVRRRTARVIDLT